jgi:hypothetical protein
MSEIWINTNEALELFKKYKLEITKTGLYYIGQREGFIKNKDKWYKKYNKNKLLKYIKNAIKPIPDGWISIKKAAELGNITVGYIYHLIKQNKIKCKTLGKQRINYVLKKEIEKYGKE